MMDRNTDEIWQGVGNFVEPSCRRSSAGSAVSDAEGSFQAEEDGEEEDSLEFNSDDEDEDEDEDDYSVEDEE